VIPELRPYQLAGIEAARQHVREGRSRVVLCLPTGGGKSVVMAAIIQSARRNFDARVVVIAHRIELIDQAVAHLAKWGVTEVGVMRGDDDRGNPLMPVQVCTIQTLARRDAPKADIVFVDEAHRAIGATYLRLLREQYPAATVFGLTATPIRSDGKPLGDVFEAIEPIATYSQLIADGFIVEPRCFGAPREPDLSKVKTIAGDYDLAGLEHAMSQSEILGDTVKEWERRSLGRRTVVFACTVAHSVALACRFEAAGAKVAHVDASTPEDERREIGARLRAGDLQVVTNVGIYTEGWDEPSVKCLILARPTKSLGLYMQMAGRALRPWEGVTPILIDQGGNVDRFGFPTQDREWSLTSDVKPTNRKPAKCIKCGAFLRAYPCGECGFAPEVTHREILERPSVELKERAPARLDPAKMEVDPKRAYFDRQVRIAQSRGFKPGFASAKYKEEYGDWPPWAWSQGIKAIFDKDYDWQDRVRERAAEREKWAPKKEQADAPVYDTIEEKEMDDGIPF
jgi:superfamily II DNA or RNA helicase